MTDPTFSYEELEWDNKYKNRKHIAFKDSIMAVGTQIDFVNYDCGTQHSMVESADAFLFNITTNVWVRLPNMHEARLGPTLVIFQGMVCALGGSSSDSAECFHQSSYEWFPLPKMISHRRDAEAVELDGELYVIGGTSSFEIKFLRPTEIRKGASQYALTLIEKYDPVTQSWTEFARLQEGRIYHGLGIHKSKIHVIGGLSNAVEVRFERFFGMWKSFYPPMLNNFFDHYERIIAISS